MGEREDLRHFIIRCDKLKWFRDRGLIGEGEERDVLGKMLFDRNNIEDVKKMLGRMWRERGVLDKDKRTLPLLPLLPKIMGKK